MTLVLSATEWSCPWDQAATTVEICPFLYGKDWAYAVEIDDGPKWARAFAVPFLAEHQWTDAPSGVGGGTKKPFVGGIAVIVAVIGANESSVNWEDLNEMLKAGWGVLNHSWSHDGYGWDPKGALSDDRVKEDAYWSQAVLAHYLSTGRAPSAAVYANGYVDYNRNGALAAVGLGVATRVAGSSPNNINNEKLNLMDFNRNYLDERAWTENDFHGDVMGGLPNPEKGGPLPGTFLIDFTHDIDRSPESANQKRWRERLAAIEKNWGAGGADNMWVAPTDAVGDYIRAAKAAKVIIEKGRLKISLPDSLPGTPLTLKLTGISARNLTAPAGTLLYQKEDTVWLTTPMIGLSGTPQPKLKIVYEGPPKEILFNEPVQVAGVVTNVFGDLPPNFTFTAVLRTPSGDQPLPIITYPGGWVVGSKLYPIIPTKPAMEAIGLDVQAPRFVTKVTVWAVDTAK